MAEFARGAVLRGAIASSGGNRTRHVHAASFVRTDLAARVLANAWVTGDATLVGKRPKQTQALSPVAIG
jgi:hypothetical protein